MSPEKQRRDKVVSMLKDLAKAKGEADQAALELGMLNCDTLLVQQLEGVTDIIAESLTSLDLSLVVSEYVHAQMRLIDM